MPTFTTEVYDEGLGHSFESTIESSNNEKGALELKIKVPEGSPLLLVTVSDLDPYVADRGPSNVRVFLKPPSGANIEPRQIVTEGGTVIYAVERPSQGTWTFYAEYESNASASVKASAYGKGFWERLRTLRRGLGCKTCKIFLKTAVEAAVLGIVLHAVPGTVVAATLGTTLQGWFGLKFIEKAWDKVLEILYDYADNPLDTMVHKICQLARACAAEA